MTPRRIAAIVLTVLIAACASRSRRDAATQPADITVETINDNYYDARIHAVYDGGQRQSIGTIAGNGGRKRTALAWQPRSLVFAIFFVIDGSSYVSEPVDVVPGEVVEVRLPANIEQSGFFRRVSND